MFAKGLREKASEDSRMTAITHAAHSVDIFTVKLPDLVLASNLEARAKR